METETYEYRTDKRVLSSKLVGEQCLSYKQVNKINDNYFHDL